MTSSERPVDATASDTPPAATELSAASFFAWVALGLGSFVLVVGLLQFIRGNEVLEDIAALSSLPGIFAAIGSWASALTAVIAGQRRLSRNAADFRARRAVYLALPGAVLGSLAVILAPGFILNTLGGFEGNQAEELAQPIVQSYTDRDATLLCTNEDSGHGPFNRQPWFVAYLELPTESGEEQSALAALKQAGYVNASSGAVYEPQYGDPTPQTTVVSSRTEPEATINVYRQGAVSFPDSAPGLTTATTASQKMAKPSW